MKIIVLAGGLSPERDVSLLSGAGICKTLREMGHQAFLLDVFFGLPYDSDKLEEIFDVRTAGLRFPRESQHLYRIWVHFANHARISHLPKSDQMLLNSARWLISHSWLFTVLSVKTENFRQLLITWESNTPDRTLLDVHYP